MLNKPFETGKFSETDSRILLLELGETYCMVSVVDPTNKTLEGVKVYTFDAIDAEESVKEIIADIPADQTYDKVVVSPAFVEAFLVPRKLHHSEAALVKATYATNAHQFEDAIPEWQ